MVRTHLPGAGRDGGRARTRRRRARAAWAWVVGIALAAPPAALCQQPGAGSVARPAEQSDPGKPLDRPLETKPPAVAPAAAEVPEDFGYPIDPPLGFTGRSSILPRNDPSPDFVPMEDRWRLGQPAYDRYDRGHALPDDYPYEVGSIWDPYQQNVLKGDYPIIGQHTFLNLTGSTLLLANFMQTPIGTTPFESTARPFQEEFFGRPNQFVYTQFFTASIDLNHGDAGFKPTDWRVHLTPVFNVNTINDEELAFVNPNVEKGVTRDRSFFALQEYFVEAKIADLSPNYDFVSARVGSQFFVSDFRGFLFSDTNRAVRLFGNANSNSIAWNLVYFRQQEKDTNSGLNTFDDRRQNVIIANVYKQDFIFPGNTVTASIHYNDDPMAIKFNDNSFRVRPENAGVFQPHHVQVAYLGLGSDGHVDRYNLTTQFYFATGRDSLNPIGNVSQIITAGMAAAELSYDRDWARFRTSFFWSSGDHNPNNHHATGFDTIIDNPNFAGGGFSFWQRQTVGLFNVQLTNNNSLIPDLRASKIQGQSNFVNPGLLLFNLGMDADITPTLTAIFNTNFLWFESTQVLDTFLFDGHIATRIGTDISLGLEYRPLASNNIQITLGLSTLIPGGGFKALFNNKNDSIDPLFAAFLQTQFLF